jgi:hypothetical protein
MSGGEISMLAGNGSLLVAAALIVFFLQRLNGPSDPDAGL